MFSATRDLIGAAASRLCFALCLLLAATAAHAQPTRSAVSQLRLMDGLPAGAGADGRVGVEFALRPDAAPARVRVYLAQPLPVPVARAMRGADAVRWLDGTNGGAAGEAGTPVWIRAEAEAVRDSGGRWSAQVAVPEDRAAADWMVLVGVEDARGAVRLHQADAPAGSERVMAPPRLGTTITLTPSTVNITDSGQTVVTDVQLLDQQGVTSAIFMLVHEPSGASAVGFAELASGTATDGIWRANLEIPRFSPTGTWKLNVYAYNTGGEVAFLDPRRSLIVTGTGDTQAPTLRGTPTVSPATVDLTDGPVRVTTTFTLLDNHSGVDNSRVYFERGDDYIYGGFGQRISGDTLDGVWRAETEVPQNTPPGSYTLLIEAYDLAGNRQEIRTSARLEIGGGDTAAPTIDGAATLSPSTVDLTEDDAVVTATIPLRDDRSGVAYASFILRMGDESIYGAGADLISGDEMAGVWQGEIYVPQATEEGTWALYIYTADAADNYDEIDTGLTLQVGGGDTRAPTLAGAPTITPSSVNVSRNPATVTVRMTVEDDASGVIDVYPSFELGDEVRLSASDVTRVSGDSLRGVWEARFDIPQNTEAGVWTLFVDVSDRAGNYGEYETGAMLAVSGSDVHAPELAGPATVTPTTLDLTGGDGVVVATVPLSDPESGVESVWLELVDGDGVLVSSAPANLISGDAHSGTWQASIPIFQGSRLGTFTLQARVEDVAGNDGLLQTTATVTVTLDPPGAASQPLPVDGATGVPERPALSWQPAASARSYDLYLWPASQPQPATPRATGISRASYTVPDTLQAGVQYRWRVVAKNQNGATEGPVWSFTVRRLADLVVSNVQVPPTAQAGQEIEVQWTVTNRGDAGTTVPGWLDAVHLSGDDKFDPPQSGGAGTVGDVRLTTQQNTSYLGPGDSYVARARVQLPRRQFGPLHILVVANASSNPPLEEADATNNVGAAAVQISLPPPPDLQITSLVVPPTVFAGQPFEVQWTVTNRGTGSTFNAVWDDMIYLTRDSVLLGATRPLRQERYRRVLNIKPDSSYTGSLTMTLPDTVSGPVYVHVVTDAFDHEFEPGGEENNAAQARLTAVLAPPADLVVPTVQGPQTASSGEMVTVSWTVKNEGPGAAEAWWNDRVYVSSRPTFDETAVPLASFPRVGALPPDQSYANEKQVRMPDGRSGPQYFFVETDWQGGVFEQQFEDNNVGASARSTQVTLSPWADLEAVSLDAPALATAGETVPFVWTVRNRGTAAARPSWRDSVFVSTESTWNRSAATFLGVADRVEALDPNASYTQSVPLRLPVAASGTMYAYVVADARHAVYEHTDEGNNVVRSAPITVSAYPPVDLAVGPIGAPVVAAGGDRIAVSWTVENEGAGATLIRSWRDVLYLSPTDTLGFGARELHEVPYTAGLRGGDSYTRRLEVKLPDDLATGRYYLIADNTLALQGGDVNPANNRRVSAAIDVTATPPPDLQVSALRPLTPLTAGQPARIEWTVQNAGPGAVRDTLWYDALYLSRNADMQEGAIRLGTAARTGALANGGSYTQTAEVTLPYYATGTYYLIAEVDAGRKIYEAAREDNNRHLVSAEILLPPPADLVVRDVRVSPDATVGDDVTVTWKLVNQGLHPAAGRMTSGVYFSPDATWDLDDALLALDERDINLAPGAQAQFSSKVNLSSRLLVDSMGVVRKLPGVAPGAYHALVRADLRNNIRETDDENNAAASAATSNVSVPTLALGTPVTIRAVNRTEQYFRIDVAAGLDLRLTMSRSGMGLPGGVYVSYGRIPTPSDYDYANANIHEDVRQVVVPSTQAGTYYVLASGDFHFAGEDFTLLGEAMGFSATSIQPRRGGQGTVTTRLTGAGFRPNSQVVLRKGGATVATAQVVEVPSTTEMTVRWNLAAVPVGTYQIFVVNAGGAEAELGESFEVEPVVTPRLELVRSAPNALLVARRTDYVFQFRNAGNVDIPYASIMLSVPGGTGVSLETSGRLMSQRELQENAGITDAQPVYVDGTTDRFIPLIALDVAPGEALEARVTVTPGMAEGTTFPIRAFARIQDQASFLTSLLEKSEQLRLTVLTHPQAVDPAYVSLAQRPEDFAAFLLDGLVRLGVLDADDIPAALDLLPAAQQNALAAQAAAPVPDFTQASANATLAPALSLTCEEVFFYTGCLAAALDCLPQLAVVPLSAGASAALCAFGLTTGCTSALDVAGSALGADFSLAGCLGLASALNCVMKELICNDLLFSLDPNDIIGPDGYGDDRWVARAQTLPFKIRFENDPEKATAPAQEVRITLPIHPNLDVRSFRLGSFGFGAFTFDVPENTAFYQARLDVRDSLGIYVDVSAGLDIEARQAFWTFRSIDPATGTLPNSPFAGFLAINDSLGRGEGFASFTVRPAPTARTGDRVEAEASIVFDLNEPIATPPVFNTVDAAAPASRIAELAEPPQDGRIPLVWSAQDDMGGTGVRSYTLYVAEGDGPFRPHASDLTDTRYVYPGQPGASYRFFVLASDFAGNTEAMKTEADVVVVSVEGPAELPTAFALDGNAPNPFSATTSIRFALPEAAAVTLEVFNVIGQRVAVLLDGAMQPPGWHTKVFDGSALASGVYFYRLRAEGSNDAVRFTETGKMVLVR